MSLLGLKQFLYFIFYIWNFILIVMVNFVVGQICNFHNSCELRIFWQFNRVYNFLGDPKCLRFYFLCAQGTVILGFGLLVKLGGLILLETPNRVHSFTYQNPKISQPQNMFSNNSKPKTRQVLLTLNPPEAPVDKFPNMSYATPQ